MTSDVPPILTAVEDGVGWVTLNRPDALNAITVDLARQLSVALDELVGSCSVIVLRGAGGNFCVGGDFHELERLRASGESAMAELFDTFGAACDRIGDLAIPVVAAVEGYAMAGGFELMLASDLVLLSADAKIADTHTNFAQVPGGGSTQRLPRLVGQQRAMALILGGGRLSAEDALAWGLAAKVVAADSFGDEVRAFALDLAERSGEAAATIKMLVRRGLEMPLAEGLALERRAVLDHLQSPTGRQGVATFMRRKDAQS